MSQEYILKQYLTSEIKDILFTEIDEDFLNANSLGFLAGIPVPIKNEDLKSFANDGLSTTKIADNMAIVIGADPEFKYDPYYIQFLQKLFDNKLAGVLCTQAEDLMQKGSNRKALCYLKAALILDPSGLQAMYCYANGCRFWYQSLEGEDCIEMIEALKSEANIGFSNLTNVHPEFAPGWYFLGYAYLNAGAYTKANIAFNHYLDNSKGQPEDDIKEIKDRVEELKDPVIIEDGKNLLIAGKYEDALRILEPYTESKFADWWPLHFYLATAYEALGLDEVAIEGYKRVLALNPSNFDAMTSLSELYTKLGDEENALKYEKKAKIVLENNK